MDWPHSPAPVYQQCKRTKGNTQLLPHKEKKKITTQQYKVTMHIYDDDDKYPHTKIKKKLVDRST